MPRSEDRDPPPHDEAARLAALRRYAVLDSLPEAGFERIVRLARHILDAPIALISFVDADRQWFKARLGMAASETPRAIAFCNLTITGREIFQVLDATRDPRFAGNPLVTGAPGLRFYAGAPLLTPDGHALGTLCILDTVPRPALTAAQRIALTDLAAAVMSELELRRHIAEREDDMARAALRERLLRLIAEAPTFGSALDATMQALREATGSLLCLLFRLAPDGRRLQLVSGQGSELLAEPAHFARLRALRLSVTNTAAGIAILEDRQLTIDHLDPLTLRRFPGAALSAARGMAAMILTPTTVGTERYCIGMGFGPGRVDLSAMAAQLQDAGFTLRPLLRRLRDAEETELFRRLVEASNDAVVLTDATPIDEPGPRIRYVNAAFTRQTGYTPAEVIGRSPRLLQGPGTSAAARQAIRDALVQGRPVRQEIRNQRRDGSVFWTDLTIAPVADATGWQTHWMSIQRDITAQRAEAQSLVESEAAFRYLFHQHPAPMWVYDKETLAFLEVNEAATAAYGWTRDEFLAMTLLDIRPASEHAEVTAAATRTSIGLSVTGPWLHLTAGGVRRQVQNLSRNITFRDRACGLVVVWDVTDQLRAEAAARDLSARLHATFESISDGLCSMDAEWRFTYVNAKAATLLRRAAAELIGHTIWEAFPTMVGGELDRRFRDVVARRETARFIFHSVLLDTWFEIAAYPADAGLTVYFRDVTARQKREERLRLLEAAAGKLNDIIMITDTATIDAGGPRTLFVNPAFERLTGYRADEIIGLTPRLLQGEKTNRAELARIHAALAAWQPIRAELLNYRKDGEEIWLELDIVPVADDTGWFTHWVSVERDITERKQSQTQLAQQAALLDLTQDAVLVRGIDHRIHYWNRSAERLYGWSAAEALGRSVLDLNHHGEAAEFRDASAMVLAEGQWSGRIAQRRKDGSGLVVESSWTLVREANGTPRAILAVNTDITERLELEQRLRQAQRLEAVGQLTGGIAHDFNNLLTVILGNAEMLAESLAGDAELSQMARMSIDAAERGAALTSRLLAFSRRQALDPKVVDVNRLLGGLHQLLRRTLGHHVEVALRTGAGLWPALIDASQLENAVLNLCINARDAMPGGGRVTVETANADLDSDYARSEIEVTPGQYVMVAVSDGGTGMAPEVAARAFEPFFTTKDVGQGSGLGLSMVFGFLKQSGGHVTIHSEPGRGTVVRMYLPRAEADASAPARHAGDADKAEPEQPRGGAEKLLVVEDDALLRDHVAGQLRELGYRVVVAGDAAAALDALRQQPDFDLLFTAAVMPGGRHGPALAGEAQRIRPGLRVLFTAGHAGNGITHHGQAEPGIPPGAPLLHKPYRRQDLAEKVRLALDTAT